MRVRLVVGVLVGLGFGGATLLGRVAVAAEPPTPLAGRVFVIDDVGGNVAVLDSPDGVLVVDTGAREGGQTLLARLQTLTQRPVRFVVDTHFHFDHVENNALFPTATLVSHHDVPARIRAAAAEILTNTPGRIEAARRAGDEGGATWLTTRLEWARQASQDPHALPALTFASELRLHLGDETVRLWRPGQGHTDGDIVVLFEKANVLHTGDLVFRQIIPYMDGAWGTSLAGWAALLDELVRSLPPDVKVIPGHGPLTNLDGLREQRAYLVDLLEAARRARAAGGSKEAFVKGLALPRYAAYADYAARLKDNAATAWDEAR